MLGRNVCRGIGQVKSYEEEEFYWYWDRLGRTPSSVYNLLPLEEWKATEVVLSAIRKRGKATSNENVKKVRVFFRNYKEKKGICTK